MFYFFNDLITITMQHECNISILTDQKCVADKTNILILEKKHMNNDLLAIHARNICHKNNNTKHNMYMYTFNLMEPGLSELIKEGICFLIQNFDVEERC